MRSCVKWCLGAHYWPIAILPAVRQEQFCGGPGGPGEGLCDFQGRSVDNQLELEQSVIAKIRFERVSCRGIFVHSRKRRGVRQNHIICESGSKCVDPDPIFHLRLLVLRQV